MAENSRRWAEISRRYRTYIKLEKRLSANTVESYMRDLEQFAHFVLRMWDVPPRKVESQMIGVTWRGSTTAAARRVRRRVR